MGSLLSHIALNQLVIMDRYIGKKYKLKKSENFEEYLKLIGCSVFLRSIAVFLTPIIELRKSDDIYTFCFYTTFKNALQQFRLNEEFDEITADGRNVRSLFTLEGNKLIHIEKSKNLEAKIVTEFKDDEAIRIMTIGNLVCKRIFEKI